MKEWNEIDLNRKAIKRDEGEHHIMIQQEEMTIIHVPAPDARTSDSLKQSLVD